MKAQFLAWPVGKLAKKWGFFVILVLCGTSFLSCWHGDCLVYMTFTRYRTTTISSFGQPSHDGISYGWRDGHTIKIVYSVSIINDGGFSTLMQEFITAVNRKLAIKVIVFNHAKLGIIQLEQESSCHHHYKIALKNTGFAEFARLCGEGWSVEHPKQRVKALG